jgi:hypothetical protein
MKRTSSVPTLIALVLLLLIFAPVSGQASKPSMQTAAELVKEKKWMEAVQAFEAIVAAEPANAAAWYQLGIARFKLEKFEPAITAFEKNLELTKNPRAMYNIACAYARLGKTDQALDWLEKSISGNLAQFVNPAQDSDLASLYEQPRFKTMIAGLDRKRRPCIYSNSARQFDFWLGEWEVFNLQGQKVGTSVIQQVADGCGLLENWAGALGGAGKSINFFDTTTGKWHQYWIGADAVPLRYSGTFSDNAMRFTTDPSTGKDASTIGRLTFFRLDENTVRQFSEQSTDNGKTWTTEYDFKYVRRKPGS